MRLVHKTRATARQRVVLLVYHGLHMVDALIYILSLSYLDSDLAAAWIFSPWSEDV